MHLVFAENDNIFHGISGGIARQISQLIAYSTVNATTVSYYGSGPGLPAGHDHLKIIHFNPAKRSNFVFFLRFLFKFPSFPKGDGVIYHLFHPWLLIPFIFFKRKIPVVLMVPGRQDVSARRKWGAMAGVVYRFVFTLAFSRASHIIFADETTRKAFQKKNNFIKNKSVVIPSCADRNIFFPKNKQECREKMGIPAGSRVVLYLGRFSREKNLPLLMDAFKLLDGGSRDMLLILAGKGNMQQDMLAYAKKSGLDNVRFMHAVRHEDVPLLINAADLLALTSDYESSPTVLREALMCNVPFVSTNAGDASFLAAENPPCEIAERNAAELAAAMERILFATVSPDFSKQVWKYDVGEGMKDYYNLYRRLV